MSTDIHFVSGIGKDVHKPAKAFEVEEFDMDWACKA